MDRTSTIASKTSSFVVSKPGKVTKVKFFELFYIIATVVYFTPTYLKNIGVIYVFYNNLLPVLSLPLIIYFGLKLRNRVNFILICLTYFVLAISTWLHHGDTFGVLELSFNGIAYCAFSAYMFDKKNYKKCLKYIIAVLEILVFSNLLTVIIFRDGLYRIYGFNLGYSNPAYLLGHRNNAVEYMIPLIGLCVLKDILDSKKYSKNTIFVLGISLATSVLTWSANAILCIVFEVLACVFIFVKEKFKFFNILFLQTI